MPSLTKVQGLQSYHSELGVEEGALTTADNIVINRNDVGEKRRGMKNYGDAFSSSSDRAKQLMVYKDRIFRHYGSTIQYDNGSGTFASFSGSYSEPESGIRMKYVLSSGNFYFTTDDGVKKISATSSSDFSTSSNLISASGGPKALDISGIIKPTAGGFLAVNESVGYRIVWGIKDANKNVILGAPSERLVIANPTGSSASDVSLTFSVPADVISAIDPTSYFYQIYRTGVISGSTNDPGDDMNLVLEDFYTSGSTVTKTDEQPEGFRVSGSLLYTNANSGGGILSSNEKPPIAKDLASFEGSVFYSNTKTVQQKIFSLLSVANFVSGTDKLIISNSTKVREYTFVGAIEDSNVICDTKANTAAEGYILINSASNERSYYIWMNVSGSDNDPEVVDSIGIECDVSGATSAADISAIIKTQCDANSSFLADFNTTDNTGDVDFLCTKAGIATDISLSGLVNSWSESVTAQGDGEESDTTAGGDILLSSLISPAQSIDETARSLVKIINADTNGICYAYYLSGPDDLPGIVLLQSRNLSDSEFYLATEGGNGANFNNSLPERASLTSITDSGDLFNLTSHPFSDDDYIYIYGTAPTTPTDSTPTYLGLFYVVNSNANDFQLSTTKSGTPEVITVDSSSVHGQVFLANEVSENEEKANRIYWSKTNEPEAVPVTNFLDIGSRDEPIERIVPLRNNLFVLKTDGVYQITGSGGDFSVDLFDNTIQIIAPDSAAILNNQIYILCTQGVATISDSGTTVVSRVIEDKILQVTRSGFDHRKAAFGVGYETDRAYMLWLPSISSDTTGTQSFRYNPFNNTWTRWMTRDNTCGVVNPSNDQLFLGAGDREYIEKERKDFDRKDFADQEFPKIIQDIGVDSSNKTIKIDSLTNVAIGDVLTQEIYMSIAKFNRLLKKLDLDSLLTDVNYFSSHELVSGDDSAAKLLSLVAQLDIDDTVTSYSTPSGSTFADIGADFNVLIGELNSSAGTGFSDYDLLNLNKPNIKEMIITDLISNESKVSVGFNMPVLKGALTLYKGYDAIIEFAPQHFGDAGILKHTSEASFVFDKNNFYSAIASFASDLSQNFSSKIFNGKGPGFWGGSVWGKTAWGGNGNDVPFRTLVPRNKQKCRYLTCKLTHKNAREDFRLLGISIKMRPISTKAYKS